ncbi:hypothetical protein, partial [Ideonella sp.]|uniref:hypothetical protein n=1 Tax=Ideonella sp. TaxID=1929293 RepID=UPI003BB78455
MKTRLFVSLMLFALTVVPLALLSAIQHREDAQHDLSTRDDQLVNFSQAAARGIAVRLDRVLGSLRADAAFPGLGEALLPAAKADPVWVNRVLMLVAQREPVYAGSVALLDRQGLNRFDTQAMRVGRSEADAGYLTSGMARSIPQLFGPLHTAEDARSALVVVAPVSAAGERQGLLRMRLDVGVVGQVLAEVLSEQGRLQGLVFDAQGQLQAWTDPELRHEDAVPLSGFGLADLPGNLQWRGLDFRGVASRVAGADLWVLVYEPLSAHEAPLRASRRDWLISLMLMCLVGLGAAFWIASRLARPV